jgi:hypothetical protein
MKRWALGFVGLLAIAWIGWQDIPGEFLQRQRTYVTDYGAIPNDGKDDSAAIIRCRLAAMANQTYHVHFPAGEYTVEENNVFHPLMQVDGSLADQSTMPSPRRGIKFSGDSANYTKIVLTDEGESHWLYDSDENAGWNQTEWEDLWFSSEFTTAQTTTGNCNGFRFWASTASGGLDKFPKFFRCRFTYFNQPFTFTGTSNTDTGAWEQCLIDGNGPIIFENDQTLCHTFSKCHLFHAGDLFWIKATSGEGAQGQGGAGQITVDACDIISEVRYYAITGCTSDGGTEIRITAAGHPFVNGDSVCVVGVGGVTAATGTWVVKDKTDTTFDLTGSTFSGTYTSGGRTAHDDPYYTLRIDDGAAFYRVFLFDSCRWELRGPQSRVIKWPGTATFLTSAHVAIRDSDLSVFGTLTGSDVDSLRKIFSIGVSKRVYAERCHFANQLAVEFTDVNTSTILGFGYQGLLEFNGCNLPSQFLSGTNDDGSSVDATRGLGGRVTLSSGYGRVRGNDCRSRDFPAERMAFDFDYGNPDGAGLGEPQKQRHRAYFQSGPSSWPTLTAGVGALERTMLLPEGATVLAVGFDKPSGGGAAGTLVGWQITNDDKTTLLCKSGLPNGHRADGHHSAQAGVGTSGVFPYSVGTDLNERRLRLSQSVNTTYTTTGGTAWVEYE